jgi:hypothetical protein
MQVKLVTGFSFRRAGLAFERGVVKEVEDELGKLLVASGKFIEHVEEEVMETVESVVLHIDPLSESEPPAQQPATTDPTKDEAVSL